MPIYTYTCKSCGKSEDRVFFSCNDKTESVKCCCGSDAEYDFGATARGMKSKSGERLYESDALGCQPEDIGNRIAEDKKMGSVADAYLPDGKLGFKSWSAKRRYMRARGFNES